MGEGGSEKEGSGKGGRGEVGMDDRRSGGSGRRSLFTPPMAMGTDARSVVVAVLPNWFVPAGDTTTCNCTVGCTPSLAEVTSKMPTNQPYAWPVCGVAPLHLPVAQATTMCAKMTCVSEPSPTVRQP
jgi:hypothetical protein